MNTKLTYAQIQKIADAAKGQKGEYEIRCLGLTMGRRANQSKAIDDALKLQRQVEAPVTIH